MRPGRRLPTSVDELRRSPLPVAHKHLVVALCEYVDAKFGGVTAMVRHAMALPDSPAWAAGSGDDRIRLGRAKRAVSRFLGSAARSAPDWATVDWIVRECVPEAQREDAFRRLARYWKQGHDGRWPPGYIGEIDLYDGGVECVPSPAPDPMTEAELHRVRVAALRAQVDEHRRAADEARAECQKLQEVLNGAERHRRATYDQKEQWRERALRGERERNTLLAQRAAAAQLLKAVAAGLAEPGVALPAEAARVCDALAAVRAAADPDLWRECENALRLLRSEARPPVAGALR